MNKTNSKQFKEILNYIENNYEENSIIYTDQISMKFGISTMLAYKYLEKVAEVNCIVQTKLQKLYVLIVEKKQEKFLILYLVFQIH